MKGESPWKSLKKEGSSVSRIGSRDITQGNIWKNLIFFFFPIWFGSVFQQLYTTVDAVIVGRYVGTAALAALGGTSSLIVDLSVGFFIGVSSGASVVISHCFGAKDNDRLTYAVRTSMKMAVVFGAILMVLGFFISPIALDWMNTPAEVMRGATLYLRVYFMGVIPSLLYNMGSGILRAVGDAKRPLYYLICTTFVNIILDIVFVAILGKGIFGAALATVLSQVVSACLVLRTLLCTKESYKLVLRKCEAHPEVLKKILKIGFPSGCQYALYTVSNIIIQTRINSLGTSIVAAWTAINKLEGMFWLTMGAFETTIMTFTGQNYGAGKMDRVRKGFKVGLIMSIALTAGICIPIVAYAWELVHIFTKDPEVIRLGVDFIYFLIPAFCTYTGTELFGGIIKGKGNSWTPMLITGISAFVVRSIWSIVAPMFWPGMNTIMFSYPLSWTISTTLFIIYFVVSGQLKDK